MSVKRFRSWKRNKSQKPAFSMSMRADIGANFLEDVDVTRYYSQKKKKPEQLSLSFRQETYEVFCGIQRTGKVECKVNLYDVKEIRLGKSSKDFEKWASETKRVDPSSCFTIFHGIDFRLKTLSLQFENRKDADRWRTWLEYLIDKKSTLYVVKLDMWILQEFMSISSDMEGISLKELKCFTNKISYSISTGRLREKFDIHDDNRDGKLGIEGFTSLTHDILHDQQIFTDCFGKYALGGRIDVKEFEEFIACEQFSPSALDNSSFSSFFREFTKSGGRGVPFMTTKEAVNFLFSKQNQIWNPEYDKVYQDMTRPLSHYWIASSHNTYLTGSQISSESSVEAYARCLRQGCRCIELDCWDGPNGMPVIYHGMTLTTKVMFVDVIKTIRDHAFVTSEYPVILSIENHCGVKQQRVMAEKFKKVFGDRLVTKLLSKSCETLPSPSQLKGKILLKCKKLPKQESDEIVESYDSEQEMDLCDSIKNGKMYIQGVGSQWEPYFFALFNDKLIYTEIDEDKDGDNDNNIPSFADSYRRTSSEDLHFSKKWFHGRIPGGFKAAEERVQNCGVEGCFLVRNSEAFAGEFSLCFLSQGRAHQMRISTNPDKSQFYLIKSQIFDSLYSLISYYRRNPFETKDFKIERFTKPVPVPERHESEPWFYPNAKYPAKMDRKSAEEILQNVPLNGAFLVRYSSEPQIGGRFVISFRIEREIKHCRIKEDGRLLVVSNQKFESIERLVAYYSNHSFYRGLKLKHAVTEELMRFSKSVENPEKVYTSSDYLETNVVKARALCSYKPDDPNMLKFEKGDMIRNVLKQGTGMWRGDYEDQKQKLFPAEFVEEVVEYDTPFGELLKGSVLLGRADLEKGTDDNLPYVVKVWSAGNPVPFRAAVKSAREAKEWQDAINNAYSQASDQKSKNERIVNKLKMAEEFSNMIVYLCAVPKLAPDVLRSRGRIFNEMTSYNEIAGEKQMGADPTFFAWYHEVQLSRVYPKGTRVDSSNYNPTKFWNYGCQMVALNYQTGDKPLQLNHGKFRDNGRCGYVLRPEYFDPTKFSSPDEICIKPMTIKITIVAARHLFRSATKPITNPYVEVEIFGADYDCQKYRTSKVIAENGLNPFWNEKFTIPVLNPDWALIRFGVSDEDSFGDSHFLGQATYPVRCLCRGYRSVQLENGFGEEIMSTMLVHLAS